MMKLNSRTDVGSYDISELYEFADKTGILERHRQMLSQPFQESQVGFTFLFIGCHHFLASKSSLLNVPKTLQLSRLT